VLALQAIADELDRSAAEERRRPGRHDRIG